MKIAEKILARASGESHVAPGQYVTARLDMAMMPENFLLLKKILDRAGIPAESFRVWDQDKFAVIIDHRVPAYSVEVATNHKICRAFAKALNLKNFYDVFPGVCHQVMVEKGHALPGTLIVGADSHTTTYGALNAASTGIGASEMAYVILTGELWFRVPETIKFDINGPLPESVYSKDIILYIAGKYGTDVAQYKAIEWAGSAIDDLSMDARLTMANMSVELGAKFGLFRADEKTLSYVKGRTDKAFEPAESDAGEIYDEQVDIDGSTLEPQVALPHSVGNVKKAAEVQGVKINQAVIASCCHGRIEDLEIAARMLKGKKVHPKVRFYAAPASVEVYREAMDRGILGALMDAGVMIGNPSCGFCTGMQGVLPPGDKCIAATPRNFKGRMGSNESEIYLASAATVTASAIKGEIVDPREVM
jgi:3-isopropylmalate/(R)-2-methylmalate dehydratase large subunit